MPWEWLESTGEVEQPHLPMEFPIIVPFIYLHEERLHIWMETDLGTVILLMGCFLTKYTKSKH